MALIRAQGMFAVVVGMSQLGWSQELSQPTTPTVNVNYVTQEQVAATNGNAPATSPVIIQGPLTPPNFVVENPGVARELLPPTSDALTLADVMASVYQSYPMITRARLESGVVAGEQQSANGWWDPKLESYSVNQPLGFYKNYRQSVGLSRNLWWGGYLSSGYRIGRGDFEPWYKERQTDSGGEFKLAWVQPLLQGYSIDPNRVALFQANLRQQSVGPLVQREILENGISAANAYWSWVSAGQVVRTQEQLLRLAQVRMEQIQKQVNEGEVKPAILIFNSQLIAEREFKLLETIRKLRESSFKLSLYLRNDQGQPMVPDDSWLPASFPPLGPIPPGDFNADLSAALDRRPELQLLDFDMRQSQLDLQLARNQTLPQFDLVFDNSKDVGEPASSSGDKTPFESELGFQGSVPLPRNKARGKIQSTQNKIAQIAQYRELQSNKIGIELQTARNALEISAERVNQAEKTVRIAIQYLDLTERAFIQGEGDLLDLNILESKTYDARFYLIDATQEWFAALAAMQRALGLDPLEQAIRLSEAAGALSTPIVVPETIAPLGELPK
jgi:Outer membrane efflux protein